VIYEHKQVNRLMWLLTIPIAAAVIAVGRDAGLLLAPVLAAVGGLTVVGFSSLTVTVTPASVTWKFGPGVFQKRLSVEDIHGARAVRNRWWYGWGIHLTPNGWLYNVGGLDAIELELADERKVRIGTDEPERLLAAIRQVIPAHRG
jgi:hypothetical protein